MDASTTYNPSLPINIYQQYKMDMIVAYYLQRDIAKNKNKEAKKKPYISPNRNIVCSRCGQQYYWCSCDLEKPANN